MKYIRPEGSCFELARVRACLHLYPVNDTVPIHKTLAGLHVGAVHRYKEHYNMRFYLTKYSIVLYPTVVEPPFAERRLEKKT